MAKRVRKPGKSLFFRLLDRVEAIGNALPHPATLFALLALGVILLSAVATAAGVGATHPGTGERIEVRSLLSGDGIRWLFENVVENFVRFPPLGLVLVAMVGIGVAEGSGLLAVLIRALVIKAPRRLITAAVVLAGIVSHVASEAGYVILIPLGAAIFLALGRHPLAGLAAAFAGVSAGFGANFLIASIDPVLAGLSESAARLLDPAITISPAVNLYFMVASGCLLVVAGTWVTERIVEPRLGRYTGTEVAPPMAELTAVERRGLVAAGITLAATTLLFLLAVVP